jgi:hypothetical protein
MTKTTMRAIFTPQALAAAVALGCCAQAQAVSFNIGEIEGTFDSSLSVGASWGMRDADKSWWAWSTAAPARPRPAMTGA